LLNQIPMNHLYFGDCLDVLKELKTQYPQPFIDLIYIDPPFNSKRNYNVLFESMDMKDANAQKQAFADTWSNYNYVDTLNEIADIDKELYTILNTFHNLKSISDSAVAYLTTMAIRIWYMHKLLKDTGSFYLHCDSTMSHYLKLICDMIFGEKNHQNEISWKRTSAHSDAKKYSRVTDKILFYSKSNKYTWNEMKVGYDESYIKSHYRHKDENGRIFRTDNLTATGLSGGGYQYEWNGVSKIWRCPIEKMQQLHNENRIHYTKNNTAELKRFLDEMEGTIITDNWNDISPLNSQAKERLGYPTQKPEALLERIIKASSNEGDVVADFFCGCGTTIAAAQKLNRKWLGADISHLAIRLIKKRLVETYGKGIEHNLKLHGMPKDIASAKELAQNVEGGRIGFQDWAIEVMLNGVVNEKKVADGGYDGYLTFKGADGTKQFALIETKSGKLTVKNMREFARVIDNEKAAVGIFVCFKENVTSEMIKEAKNAGHIKIAGIEFPQDKIQIITAEDLFEGKQPQLPGAAANDTFKKAQRNESKSVSKGLFD
jgi:DNA modification methylase